MGDRGRSCEGPTVTNGQGHLIRHRRGFMRLAGLFRAPPRRERKLLVRSLCLALAIVAMLSGDIPPNQTIYINNLSEKVKKEG